MKKITKTWASVMLVMAAFMMLPGCNKPSSEKKILSFKFYEPAVEATVMESAKTVIATVPAGTNVTTLVPIILVSDNATVYPASGIPQNFTSPKTYSVTAEDGTQVVYTVTVTFGSGGGNGGDNGGGNGGSVNPQTYTITTSANPADGGTVTGGGTYTSGTSVTLRATANANYTFDHWQDGGSANPRAITVASNATYTAYFTYTGGSGSAPEGAVNGKFSVNANEDMVYFSQGNLQYTSSTWKWSFMQHQYDMVETNGQNVGDNYANQDVVSLFGWGTSGYHYSGDSYNRFYYPGATFTHTVNTTYNSYGYGPSTNMSSPDLTGNSAEYDWGVHNAISNGGNQVGLWRTLTNDEWVYVFYTRSTTSGIRFAKARVNDVNGVILLPDDWNSGYYNLSNTNTSSASFSSNIITALKWNTLEQHGAVFLPAAGYRNGTSVYYVGSYGYYWSASSYGSFSAFGVFFDDGYLSPGEGTGNSRYYGHSVRLVRSAR